MKFSDQYSNISDEILMIRKKIFTPLDQAVEQIAINRSQSKVLESVKDFLDNDIPIHFDNDEFVFYLSRFIATPNLELLKTLSLINSYPNKLVIGEDLDSIFVSNNKLKKALGKLSVIAKSTNRKDDILENFTILDFHNSNGKKISTLKNNHGENLVNFHHDLFKQINFKNEIRICDESKWIDRNFRDDISKQYERMLALLCYHGIMFESYPTEEHNFLKTIVYPAFMKVYEKTGVKPLIVEHISDEEELDTNWNAYPIELYETIKIKSLLL